MNKLREKTPTKGGVLGTVFTHEKIEIRGLSFLKSLLDLKVISQADEHGKLLLEAYAKDGVVEDVEKAIKGKEIEVWPLDDELNVLEDPIFCGVITDYEVDTHDEVSKIKVKALTGSYLLDLEKKSRSFQDVSMTYKDIVKKVMGTTNGNALFSEGDRKIGKPLIQYHETDWEFIKRLASHFNSPVIPDTKSTKPNIWFGINENGDEREIDDAHYTVGVSENYYKACAKSYNAPHSGFMYYVVKEQNNCFIGDKTRFRSSNLVVCNKIVELIDSELVFTYTLGVKTLLSKNIEYNAKITGMSLIGTVKKTDSETVNIQLDIDGPNGGYEYPYKWAPTSGNVMYCMPKLGTKVTLLLPNDDERDATATNAPRENGGETGTCEAMSDPNNRAFVSEHHKKMNLFPEFMQFVGTGGDSIGGNKEVPLHTTIEDEVGITAQSHNMLMLFAKKEIDFKADKISILSKNELAFFRTSETQGFDDLIVPIGTGLKRVEDNKNNPPTGGDATYILSDGFDFKGVNNVVKGWDYQEHKPFDDAPEEGKFNWLEAVGKAAQGFVVGAIAVAVIALTFGVALGPALVIGAVVGGSIAAGCQLHSDYKDGNVSSAATYIFQITIGAVTGAFGGVLGTKLKGLAHLNRFTGHLIGGAIEGVLEASMTHAASFFVDGIDPLTWGDAFMMVGLNTLAGGFIEGSAATFADMGEGDSFFRKMFCNADPVSTITGTVFYDDVDFEYDGVIPFRWTRSWISSNSEIGNFGYGTSFSYGMYIKEKENEFIYVNEDGSEITYRKLEANTEVIDRMYKKKIFYDGKRYTIFNFTTREYNTFEKVAEERIYKLISIENETQEHSINFEYNLKGYLKKAVDTTGKIYLISTNQTGQITKVESNGETIIEYKYDDNLNMLGLKDISGGETFIEYDGHLMISKTSKEGDTFYWEYEGEGHKARCIHTYGDEGPSRGFNPETGEKTRVLEYYFKYNEGSTKSTDSLGYTTVLYYDENNVPYKEELADGSVKLFTYNEFNELVEETSPDGEVTSYKYNDLGLIEEVTTPTGGTHSFEYTLDGKISKVINPIGATREWVYDESGKLVEEKALNGAKTFYEYQEKGLVSKIIEGEEEQLITTLEYDNLNNVTKAILPTGAIELWEYDKDGNCISNTTPLGTTTKIEYDKCSRISKIHSPDGNVTELEYNYYNKVTKLKDKEKIINLKYDSLANVIERKEEDKTIGFAYDTEGRLVEVTNEVGEKYKYVRDHNGDVVEEIGYDNVWKKYRRTKGGKVRGTKRSNTSKWTKISYDKGGLLTSILYPDGKEDSYKYGIMGELLEAENESAKLTFTYDEAGNLVEETNNGYTITSEYNSKYRFSQRTKILSSLGLDLDLTHNELGQVGNIEAGFGNIGKWQNSFKYNDIGQLISRDLSENLTESLSYDGLGRIKNQSVSQNSNKKTSKNYTWDIGNRIKSIVDEVSNVGLEYSYDKYGNLETEKCTGIKLPPNKAVVQRSFDKGGNLYSMRSKADREYKKGGQLVKTNRATYLYNDAGDLIEKKDKDGKWLYEYFENGLLSKVVRPDKNEVTFEYDPLGRRIGKTYKDKTTKFLWDGNKVLHEWKEYESDVPEELKVLATPKNITTWLYRDGSFAPIGKLTENDSYSIITDHLGTPTEMYNSKGERVWKVIRDIYGRERHKVGGETQETDCQIRFQGQYEDYETGLYYNRNRYYMPDEGMYSQRDPIGIAGGNPSLYGYVWDSTGQVDVFGLDVCPTGRIGNVWTSDSNYYETAFRAQLEEGIHYPGLSRGRHFQEANEQLYKTFQKYPDFAKQMEELYPGIIDGVSPGARGAFPRTAPTDYLTWHHNAYEPGALDLMLRVQHEAGGNIDKILHPGINGAGGMATWGK